MPLSPALLQVPLEAPSQGSPSDAATDRELVEHLRHLSLCKAKLAGRNRIRI